MNEPEGVYKRLARIYTEEMGRRWQAEDQALREQNVRTLMPKADERIRRATSGKKHNRAVLSMLAAAAAVVLLLTGLWRLPWWAGTLYDSEKGSENSEMTAPDVGDSTDAQTPSSSEPNLLPLSFTPPEDLWVQESKLDNGISVYIFGSATYGRTVLTMELLGDCTDPDFSGMEPMDIDGDEVYAKIDRDSRVITFVRFDILYTVSSPYSTDVLVLLYRAIVRGQ